MLRKPRPITVQLQNNRSRNILGVSNKSCPSTKIELPQVPYQSPYKVPKSIQKFKEKSLNVSKSMKEFNDTENEEPILKRKSNGIYETPPLEILEIKDQEHSKKGKQPERLIQLEPTLFQETAKKIKDSSYFPLTTNQSEAITRKQALYFLILRLNKN